MSVWNPDQYDRFKAERSQPFYDLMALVRPREGMRVVDLGCGTGELTGVLHGHLGAASTLGIDRSDTMLAPSADHQRPGLGFEQADIASFRPEAPFDLVFSNAALQWIDDHEALWPQVASWVAPGGQLAVQIPANHDHPSHVTSREVAAERPFAEALGGWQRSAPVLPPEDYAALLDRLGFVEQHVRLQIYPHHLPGPEAVVEWTRGTLLTAYEERLEPELYARFLARYRELLMPRLGQGRPWFYGFKRILMWGRKAN